MRNRRQFLEAAAFGTAWLALRNVGLCAASAKAAESRIDVLLEEPIGTIAPEIYGHFVENLGGVVYDGIWVGENSKVAHIDGLRQSLIDSLSKIKPAVIRWPGGCFADQYDWRDGIGPRAKRPTRTNFWVDAPEWPKAARRNGPQFFDPNQFGTIEFTRFCRLTGAQPYFGANLRSLPGQEFWRWVEYCNAPKDSTTLAKQREADGDPDPLNVRLWGVGNESWGCGGNFTPEDYATEFRRFTAWIPGYGVPLRLVGSGPNGDDYEWTRRFFAKMGNDVTRMWGWALHHYAWNASAGRTTNWYEGKRDALKFDTEQYYELLYQASLVETLITGHWRLMAQADPQHQVKLLVDEWGAWHAPGTEPFAEALIGQQNTLRDAILAGLSLDTFNRHADKIGMANVAQLVNCLHSLFFAHEDKFCVTPTYHVFAMYASHQGAQSVRTVFSAPSVTYSRNSQPATLAGLTGSASVNGKTLTLTVTNPSLDQVRQTEIVVRGGDIRSIRATVLASHDVHSHNSFESPNEVQPKAAEPVSAQGGVLVHDFPPASVTKLEIALG